MGASGDMPMKADRLNAFTDGVIAIIITIMVLALPVPKSAGLAALEPLSERLAG